MLRRSFHASVIFGLLFVANSGAREWTDSTGAFTVEATLVEVLEDSVIHILCRTPVLTSARKGEGTSMPAS